MKRLAIRIVVAAGVVAGIAACDRVVDLTPRGDAVLGSIDAGDHGDGMAVDTGEHDDGMAVDTGEHGDGMAVDAGDRVPVDAGVIDGGSDAPSE
jgi:hypothetical protein